MVWNGHENKLNSVPGSGSGSGGGSGGGGFGIGIGIGGGIGGGDRSESTRSGAPRKKQKTQPSNALTDRSTPSKDSLQAPKTDIFKSLRIPDTMLTRGEPTLSWSRTSSSAAACIGIGIGNNIV